MIWIKQLDGTDGSILKTMDWDSPQEGINIVEQESLKNIGIFQVLVLQQGTKANFHFDLISHFSDYVGSWFMLLLHGTLILGSKYILMVLPKQSHKM